MAENRPRADRAGRVCVTTVQAGVVTAIEQAVKPQTRREVEARNG